jgi:hypothetical protein
VQVGSFYGNVTLLGVDIEAVMRVVPRPAFVMAEDDAVVVVFAEIDDSGAPQSGAGLSAELGCVAFSAGVHDDDIFFCEVHDRGRPVVAGAVPDPSAYFGIDADLMADMDPDMAEAFGPVEDAGSAGGPPDPSSLVGALGRGDPDDLRRALEADFVFATERHTAVLSALGLPAHAAGWGFRYLASDATDYGGPPLTRL